MTGEQAIKHMQQQAWAGRKAGLSRIQQLLCRLDNPHESLKFVHITGTNGKGSTAAMLASILTQAGLKTGLFTSPHLFTFHERFQIDGENMPDEHLGRIAEQVLQAAQGMDDPATEFELMTAIGLCYFRQSGCEIVVLEVGLGGRLDSTNVIPPPEVAVLTNIGLEHTQELGDTLEAIAAEKSGIIKHGSHTVLYRQSEAVRQVVAHACEQAGSALTLTAPEQLTVLKTDLTGQRFTYRGQGVYEIALLGEYQLQNACAVLETVWALRVCGWKISEQAIVRGFAAARWPARMELARRSPDVFVDGGHNPQCMAAIASTLKTLYPDKKVLFLIGVLEDKDYPAMLSALLPLAKGFVTLTPDSPRALSAQALAEYLKEKGAQATPAPAIEAGVQQVLDMAHSTDVVCSCGSLYMAGAVRHALGL